ncbi:MAG: hypothetical protein ACUVYA_18250 [Planctomycetota bacterium]
MTLSVRIRSLKGEAIDRISAEYRKLSRLAFRIENVLGEIEMASAPTQDIEIRLGFSTNLDRYAQTLHDRDRAESSEDLAFVRGCTHLVSGSDLALRIFAVRFVLGFPIPPGDLDSE